MNRPLRWLLAGSVAWGCLLLAPRAEGSEPAREFLDGLRQRGYFEEALDYLEQVRADESIDASFREVIDYEAGLTLIDLAHSGRPGTRSEKLLDQADQRLARFLAEHPRHVLAAAAKTQLAGVLVERGRLKAEQAQAFDPVARRQSIESVRALYRQAETAFLASEKQFGDVLDKFPRFIDPKDIQRLEQREQVRRDLLQVRLALARVGLEIAQTYEPGTPDNQAHLREAAKRYGDLFDKHRRDLGGLYARLGQARCCKELGQPDQALAMFAELLPEPDEPETLAPLRAQATRLAMETALSPDVEKYREAMEFYDLWQRAERGEPAGPEVPALHYLAGQAALQYARSLREDDKDQAALRAECLSTARKTLALVADQSGPYQSKAKALLADPLLQGPQAKLSAPASFAEARDRGNAALDRMSLIESEAEAVGRQAVKPGGGPWPGEIAAARQEAIQDYTLALRWPAAKIPAEDRDWVRYYLAYLHYKAGDFREAATSGEELARQDPRPPQARRAAKIALAAYASLFNQAASGPQRRADGQRMLAIAEFIVRQWQDEPEAELIVGRAAWTAWIEAWRVPPDQRPPPPELDALLERARRLLTAGIESIRQSADAGGKVGALARTGGVSPCTGADRAVRRTGDPGGGMAGRPKNRPGSVVGCPACRPTARVGRGDLSDRLAGPRGGEAMAAGREGPARSGARPPQGRRGRPAGNPSDDPLRTRSARAVSAAPRPRPERPTGGASVVGGSVSLASRRSAARQQFLFAPRRGRVVFRPWRRF